MSELAIAAFAARTGAHLVDTPRQARFAAFERSFDASTYAEELAAAGVRWLARSDPAFPALLRAIHDPPVGLFVRGSADVSILSGPAVAVVGARAWLVVRDAGRAVVRARPGRRGARRRERPRTRGRRRGAPWRC